MQESKMPHAQRLDKPENDCGLELARWIIEEQREIAEQYKILYIEAKHHNNLLRNYLEEPSFKLKTKDLP